MFMPTFKTADNCNSRIVDDDGTLYLVAQPLCSSATVTNPLIGEGTLFFNKDEPNAPLAPLPVEIVNCVLQAAECERYVAFPCCADEYINLPSAWLLNAPNSLLSLVPARTTPPIPAIPTSQFAPLGLNPLSNTFDEGYNLLWYTQSFDYTLQWEKVFADRQEPSPAFTNAGGQNLANSGYLQCKPLGTVSELPLPLTNPANNAEATAACSAGFIDGTTCNALQTQLWLEATVYNPYVEGGLAEYRFDSFRGGISFRQAYGYYNSEYFDCPTSDASPNSVTVGGQCVQKAADPVRFFGVNEEIFGSVFGPNFVDEVIFSDYGEKREFYGQEALDWTWLVRHDDISMYCMASLSSERAASC
jgi:hypothetical protein